MPEWLGVHQVAQAYGVSPSEVRSWPVSDYREAMTYLIAKAKADAERSNRREKQGQG